MAVSWLLNGSISLTLLNFDRLSDKVEGEGKDQITISEPRTIPHIPLDHRLGVVLWFGFLVVIIASAWLFGRILSYENDVMAFLLIGESSSCRVGGCSAVAIDGSEMSACYPNSFERFFGFASYFVGSHVTSIFCLRPSKKVRFSQNHHIPPKPHIPSKWPPLPSPFISNAFAFKPAFFPRLLLIFHIKITVTCSHKCQPNQFIVFAQ